MLSGKTLFESYGCFHQLHIVINSRCNDKRLKSIFTETLVDGIYGSRDIVIIQLTPLQINSLGI